MPTIRQKAKYFKRMYEMYDKSDDMTVREFKEILYNDKLTQKLWDISENMVDSFWDAFMDGAYDPERLNLKPQSYQLF